MPDDLLILGPVIAVLAWVIAAVIALAGGRSSVARALLALGALVMLAAIVVALPHAVPPILRAWELDRRAHGSPCHLTRFG